MKELINKYKGILSYLFFGGCTTLVNIVVYAFGTRILFYNTVVATVVAWTAAVVFAYLTNRKWVFGSEARGSKAVFKEIVSFLVCRLITGALDVIMMYIFVDILNVPDIIMKVVSNVIVIVVNYVASKMIIFKGSRGEDYE